MIWLLMDINSMNIKWGLTKEKACFHIEGWCLNRNFSNKYSETLFLMPLWLQLEIDEIKESNRSLFCQDKEPDFI